MTGAVIYWWNQRYNDRDYEEFDSMDEALAELEIYKQKYPWNTYTVASVALVHKETEKYKELFRWVSWIPATLEIDK